MYPISATCVLKSPGGSFQDEIILHIRRFSSSEELRNTACSKIAFCAAVCDERSGEILVCDDGGNEIARLVSAMNEDSRDPPFMTFTAADCLCGLSGGSDLFFPEHSRALALSGVEVLCCFPSEEASRFFSLGEFARVRAVENNVFFVLIPPCGKEIACWGPTGEPLPLFADSREEPLFVLHRGEIARARKRFSSLSLRKKHLRSALAAL